MAAKGMPTTRKRLPIERRKFPGQCRQPDLPTKLPGKRSRRERYLQTTIPRPNARLPRPQRKMSQTHMPRLTQPERVFGNSPREKQPSPRLVRRHFCPSRNHIRSERRAQDGRSALGQKLTCAAQKVMPALPPKADTCDTFELELTRPGKRLLNWCQLGSGRHPA